MDFRHATLMRAPLSPRTPLKDHAARGVDRIPEASPSLMASSPDGLAVHALVVAVRLLDLAQSLRLGTDPARTEELSPAWFDKAPELTVPGGPHAPFRASGCAAGTREALAAAEVVDRAAAVLIAALTGDGRLDARRDTGSVPAFVRRRLRSANLRSRLTVAWPCVLRTIVSIRDEPCRLAAIASLTAAVRA